MVAPWRRARMTREPFRLFFPLGIVLGWAGVGHWLLYGLGLTNSYSCLFHGLVQTQAFVLAFALGFLMTALPRRTQSAPVSRVELGIAVSALVAMPVAAALEHWAIAEACVLTMQGVLLCFALPRLFGRGAARRPPASFVLLPWSLAMGVAGSAIILGWALGVASPERLGLARLLAEQGAPICLVVGAGRLILPLVTGQDPPRDMDGSPAARRALAAWSAAGLGIAVSLGLEHVGQALPGGLLRAGIVAGCLVHARQPPRRPGLHRWLVWLAIWLVPVGVLAAALLPDYRVAALHVTFIGGFGTLVLGVATHVALGHLGLEQQAQGRPAFVVVLAVTLFLALLARLAADASQTYFAHLASAAGMWLVGSTVWLAVLGPRLLRSADPGKRN